ncbi:MAG TPA: beta-ketoacyl-[acyl-carrier-protein] synthase family protein [Puia sp.]|nr:beta-ketoacyl-[acyl-carrier-protein] synthase family protein [Puia sp.]
MSRVFITGMGVISAIGNTTAENHRALIAGNCGITKGANFPSRYAGVLPFGEILIPTSALQEQLRVSDTGVTRTTLLALHAFKEAIADAGLSPSQLMSPDTALVGATTVGGMCLMDQMFDDANKNTGGSDFLSSYDCASVNMFLQAHYKMKGLVNTINTACSSSSNAILYGARLIKNGFAKRVLVGGADSLSKFTINGFNALHILSPEICAPFDRDRQGLNLGEGAAFLVLEGEDVPRREEAPGHRKVYAELTGYCNTNDAYHPSSLSGDGPYLAMKGALQSAQLSEDRIDFINAHGTGTENNDEVESRVMLSLFGTPPPFSSAKSNIGHTLGAAGAVEAVYSILNLVHQEIYAGLNFKEPIPATGLRPVQAYQKMSLEHVMSNSFGFGGNCTSLIFSKA